MWKKYRELVKKKNLTGKAIGYRGLRYAPSLGRDGDNHILGNWSSACAKLARNVLDKFMDVADRRLPRGTYVEAP
jgi:hypothetical protein